MKSRLAIHLAIIMLIAARALAADCKPADTTSQFAQSGQAYSLDLNTVIDSASEIRIEESLDSQFRSILSTQIWRRSESGSLPSFIHESASYRLVHYRVSAFFPDGSGRGGCTWTGRVAILDGADQRAAFGHAIVPVAGSLTGANDSHFRTAMTLFNPFDLDMLQGEIVFHPAGRSGSRTDPSLRYQLAPGQHIEYTDVIEAIGTSGLGSLDIIPSGDGLYVPAVQVTVYNDAGNGAAYGMSVPQIRAADLQDFSKSGALTIIVSSRAQKRLNIGVRSGARGGTLVAHIRRTDGAKAEVRREYGPDYFIQSSAEDFLGVPLSTGDQVSLEGFGAVVYATETNNVTNDPQILIPFVNTSDYFVGNYFW